MKLASALSWGRQQLRLSGIESATLDARLLLMHLTGLTRSALIVHDDDELEASLQEEFERLVKKRATGYPTEYILGYKEFWGLKLKVNEHTLIPRPDTETLVEQALTRNFSTVLDLGTGSGAVILALKHERPKACCYACDLSLGALDVASYNASSLGLEIEFKQSSWFDAYVGQRFDLIVSNPPYIEEGDEHLSGTSLPFEPQHALSSGVDGLDAIREIVKKAPAHLNSGGALMLEHGYNQGEEVRALLLSQNFINVKTVRDLGGNERVSYGELPVI